jgi:hypothetical protein
MASAICVLSCVQAGDSALATPYDPDHGPVVDASAIVRDAALVSVDSPIGLLDASVVTQRSAFDCTPGQYHGDFSCLIVGLVPWSGDMNLSLVALSDHADEFATLVVVPGTRIIGHDDSFDGTFDAELKGTFDCRTKLLTGSMEGSYLTPNLGFPLSMTGDLRGTYGRDAGADGFDGTMGPLKTPDLDILGPLAPDATCTWKAVRVGDVARDAGADAGTR